MIIQILLRMKGRWIYKKIEFEKVAEIKLLHPWISASGLKQILTP